MNGRRSRGPKHGKSGSSAWTIVVLVLVGAAFIYIYQALDINSILFKPASSSAAATTRAPTPRTTTPAASPSSSISTASTSTPTAASSDGKISEEVKLNGGTLYCVQLGAFAKLDNAQAFSDASKANGSAGYLLKDDALYRVIDSVYYAESDANAVRDAYRSGAYQDACVVTVKSTGLDWKVNASRDQIDAIKSVFSTIQVQTFALINIQKTAQQNANTASGYAGAAGICSQAMQNSAQAMMKAVGQTKSTVILSLNDCLNNCAASLSKLAQSNTADGNAFLSGLKYSIIDFLLALQTKVMQ